MRFFSHFRLKTILALALWVAAACAHAELNVDITGVGSNQFPIAVAKFRGEDGAPQQVSEIVREDLARSGRFLNIDTGAIPVADSDSVNLGAWRAKGANAFVSGSVTYLPSGSYDVRFRLYDTLKQQYLGGLSLMTPRGSLRTSAHKIADYIYQRLLGVRGIFSTRLSYVVHTGRYYQLQISDSDGKNAHIALSSPKPIISPSWSPDGTKIAYVSFEKRKPIVYIHDLPTGRRFALANFKGSNSAPDWSPNGRYLAIALTLTGNTQIYRINADGSGLVRLSNSNAIDTEPRYSPDGRWIYFTSDRGGGPQIYRMSSQGEMAGGPAVLVTNPAFCNYITSPRISPDGRMLAYIARIGGGFKLYIQDLSTGTVTGLTNTTQDESPSFAANGQYLLYATVLQGRKVLAAVSIDGTARQVLSIRGGSVTHPSWGPFM